VTWGPRAGQVLSFAFPIQPIAEINRDGIGFRCYTTTATGINARMITVAAINGYAGRGWAYFEQLQIRAGDQVLENLTGRHAIAPRGAILRRFFLGPEAEKLRSWDWVNDPRPAPTWAAAQATQALGQYRGQVGPYKFQWAYKSLSNSHGGQGVAPFHGGPEDWLTNGPGRRLREQEMLAAYQRPIWILGPTPEEPYWMGRTMAHRLKGFNADPDGWCTYAGELNTWRPADHTHLSRTTGGAGALAKWDPFARACLLASWKDFKAANSLTRPKESSQHLLWPLWAKVEAAAGPLNSEGDRGLAHWLRLMRWCRPYVDAAEIEPYQTAYREWAARMGNQYGLTRTSTPTPSGVLPPVDAPYVQAFHPQLVQYEMAEFGGMGEQAARIAKHLTPQPPWYFEARDGNRNDTTADRDGSTKPGYAPYAAMTHHLLRPAVPAKAFLESQEDRGINGSSQDLDCTPRALWEPGLKP
jgi:hypothetical protein